MESAKQRQIVMAAVWSRFAAKIRHDNPFGSASSALAAASDTGQASPLARPA
jgi:hypothetical protein